MHNQNIYLQEVSKKLDLFAWFACFNLYLCWIYNTSNNIQSQDGNSRITLCNLKKLEKTTLADISSLSNDFVGATVGFMTMSFYLHRVSLNISTYIFLTLFLSAFICSVLFNNDMQQDILDFPNKRFPPITTIQREKT